MKSLFDRVIGFIGAGKVGVTLGAYFQSKKINIGGYYSRNADSAANAAGLLSVKQYTDLQELLLHCDIIMITTPDDQIKNVWEELKKYDIGGKIIAHTSGSLTSGVFDGIASLEAFAVSIHPMHAFSDRDGNIEGLDQIVFTIEGDITGISLIKKMLTDLGNQVLVIESENKACYHLANVMASNLVLALLKISSECLAQCGINQTVAIEALMPLIMNNIENIRIKGFHNALTGPIERNDVGTITQHLAVVPGDYESIYKNLSLILLKLAIEKNPTRDYGVIEDLLTVSSNND